MAHNINNTNGKDSMMYYGEKPWHGLGTELKNPATAKEAIVAAGLNFDVVKMPLFINTNKGKLIKLDDKFATVRTDTNVPLGVVGARYQPVQNSDAFSFFDSLVGEGESIYHTAGALGKGERIWLLAKMPDYIKIKGVNGKEDIVEKFVLLANSHDGTSNVIAKLTPIRVVCNNTLSLALKDGEQEVRIRHTANAEERMKEAHKVLGLTNKLYSDLETIFNSFSNKQVKKEVVNEFFLKMIPDNKLSENHTRSENQRLSLMNLYDSGKGSEMSRGTVWGLYNAVTEYVDHEKYSNKQMKKEDFNKIENIWFSNGERMKQQAFNLSLELVKK